MLPDNYDVLWQMATCYDIQGDFKQVRVLPLLMPTIKQLSLSLASFPSILLAHT